MTDYSAPPAVERIEAAAYTIPTEQPESDGTLQWDSTTLVVVTAHAAGVTGIGYSYAGPSAWRWSGRSWHPPSRTATPPRPPPHGPQCSTASATWAGRESSRRRSRPSTSPYGTCTPGSRTCRWPWPSAKVHQGTPIYGSGGFTSYDDRTRADQLSGWAEAGIPRVKIKVGRDPDRDEHRLEVARTAIGDDVQLFVDANGAYSRKQALWWAERFAGFGVGWYEEPVSSDDLQGVRHLEYFHDHVRIEGMAFERRSLTRAPWDHPTRPVAARPGPRGQGARPGGISRRLTLGPPTARSQRDP